MELMPEQVDRARGVLLGAAVGDALGAGYEFGSAELPPDGWPQMIGGGLGGFEPGEWTDDTAMTWAVADAAARGLDLRTPAGLDVVAAHFREWYDTDPADIGINVRAVLAAAGPHPTAAAMTAAAEERHRATGRTGANGSLMRTSPVALAYLDDPAGLVDAARSVSRLTHPDPRAQEACVLWCLAIREAVLSGGWPDVRTGLAALDAEARAFWAARVEEAEREDPGAFAPNGYVVTALQAAWAAIQQAPEMGMVKGRTVNAVLATAIRIGDDTDTVASIAGALIGAWAGRSAIQRTELLHGYPGLTATDLDALTLRILGIG